MHSRQYCFPNSKKWYFLLKTQNTHINMPDIYYNTKSFMVENFLYLYYISFYATELFYGLYWRIWSREEFDLSFHLFILYQLNAFLRGNTVRPQRDFRTSWKAIQRIFTLKTKVRMDVENVVISRDNAWEIHSIRSIKERHTTRENDKYKRNQKLMPKRELLHL